MIKSLLGLIFILLFSLSSLGAKNGYNYYYYGAESKLGKTAIVNIATHQIQRLILKKKIPKNWETIKHSHVNKAKKTAGSDWVVTFKNTVISNKKRQTLYIFVGENGTVKGVNYTGH